MLSMLFRVFLPFFPRNQWTSIPFYMGRTNLFINYDNICLINYLINVPHHNWTKNKLAKAHDLSIWWFLNIEVLYQLPLWCRPHPRGIFLLPCSLIYFQCLEQCWCKICIQQIFVKRLNQRVSEFLLKRIIQEIRVLRAWNCNFQYAQMLFPFWHQLSELTVRWQQGHFSVNWDRAGQVYGLYLTVDICISFFELMQQIIKD